MPRRRRNPRRIIRNQARSLGIGNPAILRALYSVAMGEGGLQNRPNDIGDLSGGGSYGPYQLFAQGALPARYRGNPALADRWAWSPQGINYALRSMIKAGLKPNMSSQQAVETIIRQFERPADPDASVRNALARLDSIPLMFDRPQAPRQNPRRPSVATQALTGQQQPAGPDPRRQLAMSIIAGVGDPTFSYIEALNDFELATIEQQANETRGTVLPPQRWRRNGPPRSGSRDPIVDKVLSAAQAQLGKPYVWGGESPQEGGFDCSGLIAWAYAQAGRPLPGGRPTTWTMASMGRSVKGKKYKPGDMIITNGGKHVVMYVGGNRVIAAPYTGAVVRYQPISDFAGDIVDVRRVL